MKPLYKFCKVYIWAASGFLIVWSIFVLSSYFMEENYRELCDVVTLQEFYHFKIDNNEACRIRWIYLLKEPVAILSAIAFLLISPAILARYYFKKKMAP